MHPINFSFASFFPYILHPPPFHPLALPPTPTNAIIQSHVPPHFFPCHFVHLLQPVHKKQTTPLLIKRQCIQPSLHAPPQHGPHPQNRELLQQTPHQNNTTSPSFRPSIAPSWRKLGYTHASPFALLQQLTSLLPCCCLLVSLQDVCQKMLVPMQQLQQLQQQHRSRATSTNTTIISNGTFCHFNMTCPRSI